VDTAAILQGDPGDPASVQAAFTRLVDVLRAALDVAPPEIQVDLALVSGGVDALDATLAEVGYDFDALAASGEAEAVRAATDDPAFTDAGIRLAAYREQVCGL
jgi:hypothetical protein